MDSLSHTLNYPSTYVQEELIPWGVSPTQCQRYQPSDADTFYLYLNQPTGFQNDTVTHNIRGRALKHQPDGIFTWIYFLDSQGRPRFECNRIMSPSELGTKHVNLLSRASSRLHTLLLAGELSKNDTNYVLNFYSGSTNMAELPNQEQVGAEFVPKFRQAIQLPQSANVAHTTHPFPIEAISTDPETLRYYQDLGYQLLFFNTRLDCQNYRSHVIRAVSLHRNLSQSQDALERATAEGNTRKINSLTSSISRLEEQLARAPTPIASSYQELLELRRRGGSTTGVPKIVLV